LRQSAGFALGATLLPLAGCESLAVDPVTDGIDFPFITPNETFFTQFGADGALANWSGIQQIPRNTWRLAVDGLVSNPATLSFADVDADPSIVRTVLSTLRCILDNNAVPGLIGTATWTGISLSHVLEQAGIDLRRARRLRLYGADGFTNNLPIEKVFGSMENGLIEPLLVYSMNGNPLRPEHGAPIRLLVPGHYGYKSIKWLERIEVTDQDDVFGTYQELLGYEDDGRIDVSCKTTSILRGARILAGRTRIAGFAISGTAGIAAIRISIDGDPYQEARIVSLSELIDSEPDLERAQQLKEAERYAYP
jgi:DMSO/TMAO reductase YedYZ molybdopterin-dependent catalytic subunit